MTTVYLCDDTIDGIFTAIYKAWEAGTSHTDVRINTQQTMSLFEEYITVITDPVLVSKVASSIERKLSGEVYFYVYRAALSNDCTRASYIYHFLQKAFKTGPSIINCLQDSDVMKIFELSRYVNNEQCRYLGFIRFEELDNNILLSRINPINNIVPIVAVHFADRLHNENWIILDTNRNIAAVHSAHHGYILTTDISEDIIMANCKISENENEFKNLWECFFNSIAIKERNNPELQRNLMPHRYRKYMTVEKLS